MKTTLVLNQDYSPINILPLSSLTWQDAIHHMFLNHVNVLHFYENWTVSSPSISFQVPSVMVLKRSFVKIKKKIPCGSNIIFLRDNYTCQYCGTKNATLTKDHVLPISKGGSKTDLANMVAACHDCNSRKGNNHLILPKIKPKEPTLQELHQVVRSRPIVIPDINWVNYIGWKEHLITIQKPIGLPGYSN